MPSELARCARWLGLALPLVLSACGSGIRIQARSLLANERRFEGEVEMTTLLPESAWEVASIEVRSERSLGETLHALRDRSADMGCDLVVVDRFETVREMDESVTVEAIPCGTGTCTNVNREQRIAERLIVHGRGFSRHRDGRAPSLDSR
jgi:hypothetical protein